MDNLSTPSEAPADGRIELNRDAMLALNETRKWAMFISICMFVVCALLLVVAMAVGAIFSAMPNADAMPFPTWVLTLIYLVIAVLYFFLYWYLFKFASSMRKALVERSSEVTAQALQSLSTHYRISGIVIITVIILYIIGIAVIMAIGTGGLIGNSVNA